MQLKIPDELIRDQLVSQIVSVVLKHVDQRLQFLTKVQDLPEYPRKSQVKAKLGIGAEKLDEWISMGLKIQQWSTKDIRIERSELQRFLKENFEI